MLLFGGRGFEHGISVVSARYIYSLVDKDKYDILPVYISRTGRWLATDKKSDILPEKNEFKIPVTLSYPRSVLVSKRRFFIDAALPVLHGDFGEDGVIQGALENAKISYAGCGVVSGALCSDKAFTKSIARELSIDVARHTVSLPHESAEEFAERASLMGYPIFVKPARLGSSLGASVANDKDELVAAVKKAYRFSKRVLAEEYISVAAELECAYFSALGEKIFSGVGSIVSKDGFYDYNSKYTDADAAEVTASAEISEDICERVKEQSKALADAIGIRHLSRFDFLLSKDARLVFNEINTFPGFTESSLYPRLIEKAGISPARLVDMLISEVAF